MKDLVDIFNTLKTDLGDLQENQSQEEVDKYYFENFKISNDYIDGDGFKTLYSDKENYSFYVYKVIKYSIANLNQEIKSFAEKIEKGNFRKLFKNFKNLSYDTQKLNDEKGLIFIKYTLNLED